jgi:hypothetical protein
MYGNNAPMLPSFTPATKNENPELKSFQVRRGTISGSGISGNAFVVLGFWF